MRALGRRTKKLIVAFHFQFSNQDGWKCEPCRKSGLERKRRCGWLAGPIESPARIVWARKEVALETCPRSYVSPESEAWVEEFFVRRKFGFFGNLEELGAREVEAFLILESEMNREARSSGRKAGQCRQGTT